MSTIRRGVAPQKVSAEEIEEAREKNRLARRRRHERLDFEGETVTGRFSATTLGEKVTREEVDERRRKNRLAREGKGVLSEEEIAAVVRENERNGGRAS